MNRSPSVAMLLAVGAAFLACSSPGVVKQGIDESFIDRSIDPCSDFYRFACGTWIEEHVPSPGYSVSRYDEPGNRRTILLEKILKDASADPTGSADPETRLLGTFYNACMTAQNQAAVTPGVLGDLMGNVRSIADPNTLASALGSLHRAGVDALFSLGGGVDPGQPTRYVTTLSQGGMSLDRDYYLDPSFSVEVTYKEHIRALAALYDPALSLDADAAWRVESILAAATPPDAERRDPVKAYNLRQAADFAANSPSLGWTRYLDEVVGPVKDVNVTEPAYFAELEGLLRFITYSNLRAYLTWRVLEANADVLGRPFIVEEARFHWGVLFGQPKPLPDWYACVRATQSYYGFALGKRFVDYLFTGEERTAAQAMIDTLSGALDRDLLSLDWLDDQTRIEARAKLAGIVSKVGYPDRWPTYAESPNDGSQSFLEAVRFAVGSSWSSLPRALSLPVNRGTWQLAPSVVNAYYSPKLNEIVFPAAILQPPFFDQQQPAALNYGAIGAVMGHELTHGFDDQGRQFDGAGALRDWWNDGVAAEFDKRASCIADQFSAYEPIPGSYIDGRNTLGENIADLGGLKLALAAYEGLGLDENLVNFNPRQQFFLAYAQIWCANVPPEQVAYQLRTDVHSPSEFRVNGAVRNLPEFAEAFHCATGSPMAPADRCSLW